MLRLSNLHELMMLDNAFTNFCFDSESAAVTLRKDGYETEE